MREAVSIFIKIIGLFKLIMVLPVFFYLISNNYDANQIGLIGNTSWGSFLCTLIVAIFLFFGSEFIAKWLVRKETEKKVVLKFSSKAVYISSGIVSITFCVPFVVSHLLSEQTANNSFYPEDQLKSIYMFLGVLLVVFLCCILIKKGLSCED